MDLKLIDFKTGDYIFKEDYPPGGVYMITKGSIEISKTKNGKKIVLEVKKQGDIFGEMSLIDDSERSATALATEDGICYMMSEQSLDEQILQLDDYLRAIFENLSKLIRKQTNRHTALESANLLHKDAEGAAKEEEEKAKYKF